MHLNVEFGMKIVTIVLSGVFIIAGYAINIHCLKKIIMPLTLSHKSSKYASTIGEVDQLTIRAGHGSEAIDYIFDLNVSYRFNVAGRQYRGSSTVGLSNYRRINNLIYQMRSAFPDQIYTISIWQRKSQLLPINDFDEMKSYLRRMHFDYKPDRKASQSEIFYEVAHPDNNCLSLDAKLSTITFYIVGLVIGTAIGIAFMGHFIPFGNVYVKSLLATCIMLTAAFPAFFMKKQLSKLDKFAKGSRENYLVYDLVVDNHCSEQYLRQQLAEQKAKYLGNEAAKRSTDTNR